MPEYALYLESGPRHRTTMVHVLDLLGCVVQGPTTEEAVASAPAAIRDYLRFLRRHGEPVDAEQAITTRVAEHVTEGPWVGYGDPAPGFGPDFQPLAADDLQVYLPRLKWMRGDVLDLVKNLDQAQLTAQPEAGRSVHQILLHAGEADGWYLRSTYGKIEGVSEAVKALGEAGEVASHLATLWAIAEQRLAATSDAERTLRVPHGEVTWTARRTLRRMLEHDWEHLLELKRRLVDDSDG